MSPLAWSALALFLVVSAAISLEAAHETIVALLGAATFLLVSMMVIVNIARSAGMCPWVAIRTAKLARGEPALILALLSVVTAVISAFLDNVTTPTSRRRSSHA